MFKWLQDALESFSRSVARIFSPSDDNYPATGAQPYEGEPNREDNNLEI